MYRIDAGGGVQQAKFDALNQRTSLTETMATNPAVATTCGYDVAGNLTRQQLNGDSTAAFTYNAANWPTLASQDGLATTYGYDWAGRVRTISLPGTSTETITVDGDGRVTGIGDGSVSTAFTENDVNQTTDITATNTLAEHLSYDNLHRLDELTVSTAPWNGSATPALLDVRYYRNAAGYVDAVSPHTPFNGAASPADPSQDAIYLHDAVGRVTGVYGSIQVPLWGYDAGGNLLEQVGAQVAHLTYDYGTQSPVNEVQRVLCDGNTAFTYHYDAYGTIDQVRRGTIGQDCQAAISAMTSANFHYDGAHRLIKVELLDQDGNIQKTVSQTYTALGQRASYTVRDNQGQQLLGEQYAYRGSQLAKLTLAVPAGDTQHCNLDDTTQARTCEEDFVYRPDGLPLELLYRHGTGGVVQRFWYVLDGQGTVVDLVDDQGVVKTSYFGYDAWGVPNTTNQNTLDAGGPWQPLRYGSYLWDDELQTYWLSVRQYDPALKRFLQPDPSEQDGVRSYAYCHDDPVDCTDPSGLTFSEEDDPALAEPWAASEAEAAVNDLTEAGLHGVAPNKLPVPEVAQVAISIGTKNTILMLSSAPQPAGLLTMGGDPAAELMVGIDEGVVSTERTASKAYANPTKRPAYAKGQAEQVWRNAMDADGRVYDPYTREELTWDPSKPRNRQWDMGHVPGKEYSKLWRDYMSGAISREEFLHEYRDPANYTPQSMNSNRNHNNEMP